MRFRGLDTRTRDAVHVVGSNRLRAQHPLRTEFTDPAEDARRDEKAVREDAMGEPTIWQSLAAASKTREFWKGVLSYGGMIVLLWIVGSIAIALTNR